MDASDAAASDSVMLALLPTTSDWCNIELPHLTLVYAGLKSDLKPSDFNELAKDAAMLAMLTSPLYLKVMAKETFGPNRDTDVFTLMPTPELWSMRRAVEKWNASQFAFNPHVTIGPTGTFVESVPRAIGFDRLLVAWGDDKITFWLKR
jgi:2'-5' RNA ligase